MKVPRNISRAWREYFGAEMGCHEWFFSFSEDERNRNAQMMRKLEMLLKENARLYDGLKLNELEEKMVEECSEDIHNNFVVQYADRYYSTADFFDEVPKNIAVYIRNLILNLQGKDRLYVLRVIQSQPPKGEQYKNMEVS